MFSKTAPIYFIEGIPGAGKTSLIASLPNTFLKIPEVINIEGLTSKHNRPDQKFFLDNDEAKVQMALSSIESVLVERGPLSTLLFNRAKKTLNPLHNSEIVESWYAKHRSEFEKNTRFRFIFLDVPPLLAIERKQRKIGRDDPWANVVSLQQIREGYLKFATEHPDSSTIVNCEASKSDVLGEVQKILDRGGNHYG